MSRLSLLLLLVAAAGCHVGDPEPADFAHVELATWNLAGFPRSADAGDAVVGFVQDEAIDLLAVQEVVGLHEWNELVAQLPFYGAAVTPPLDDSALANGFAWRTDHLLEQETQALFTDEADVFLRAPLQVEFEVSASGHRFVAIVVHLKAGVEDEDEAQRLAAVQRLAEHADDLRAAGHERIVLIGDFNETPGDPRSDEVYGALTDGGFTHLTAALDEQEDATFLPAPLVLDHLFADGLRNELDGEPMVIGLDDEVEDYEARVSDHRPVLQSLAFGL